MENNSSLFSKLMAKLHLDNARSKSIIKNVRNGLCAALLSTALLFSTGCQTTNTSNNNENSSQTGNNNNQENKDPYAEYSEVLKTVLTDYYYTNLVNRTKIDPDRFNGNDYKAIPFEFLEDEGYNIKKIRNNELSCESHAIVIGNDLYLSLNVETKSTENYYTCYVLKYSITEKEHTDLKLIYKSLGSSWFETYIQAPLFIQELDKIQEPELISKAHIATDAYEHCVKCLAKANHLNTNSNSVGIAYMGEAQDGIYYKQKFFIFSSVNSISIRTQYDAKVGTIVLTTGHTNVENIDGNDVFYQTKSDITTHFFDEDKESFNNSIQYAEVFASDKAHLIDLNDELKNNVQK